MIPPAAAADASIYTETESSPCFYPRLPILCETFGHHSPGLTEHSTGFYAFHSIVIEPNANKSEKSSVLLYSVPILKFYNLFYPDAPVL